MDHVEIIVVMAIAALGMFVATGEGMIFEAFGKWVERTRPNDGKVVGKTVSKSVPVIPLFWQKPIATCPRCMVTIYGTAAAILIGVLPLDFAHLIAWPVYILCAVGLQELLSR